MPEDYLSGRNVWRSGFKTSELQANMTWLLSKSCHIRYMLRRLNKGRLVIAMSLADAVDGHLLARVSYTATCLNPDHNMGAEFDLKSARIRSEF